MSDPLESGAEVPTHLPLSNILPVTRVGAVRDAATGRCLLPIVPEDFFLTVKENHETLRKESPDLHYFRISAGRIYHTRDLVTVELE